MKGRLPGLKHRHAAGPLATRTLATTTGATQVIRDLGVPHEAIEPEETTATLVGYPYGRALGGSHPVEAWTIVDGESRSQSEPHRVAQARMIRRVLWSEKPAIRIDEPVVLLPHYTSHFGHFVAEILGQLLHHATTTIGGPACQDAKLVAVLPSPAWRDFVATLVPPRTLHEIDADTLLTSRIEFTRARRAVPISAWQNMAIARNHIGASLHRGPRSAANRILLIDAAHSRIANLSQCTSDLARLGFSCVDPTVPPVATLLRGLRDAEVVVCEASSILMNVALARVGPTLVLTPEIDDAARKVDDFVGGPLYNEFLRGSLTSVPCRPVGNEAAHPLSQHIHVEPQRLLGAVEACLNPTEDPE